MEPFVTFIFGGKNVKETSMLIWVLSVRLNLWILRQIITSALSSFPEYNVLCSSRCLSTLYDGDFQCISERGDGGGGNVLVPTRGSLQELCPEAVRRDIQRTGLFGGDE